LARVVGHLLLTECGVSVQLLGDNVDQIVDAAAGWSARAGASPTSSFVAVPKLCMCTRWAGLAVSRMAPLHDERGGGFATHFIGRHFHFRGSNSASLLDSSSLAEMFHGSDQLPLGPHANRVLVHRSVDDGESHKRRKFETLQADADLGGTLADRADVRRGGDDFVDTARALLEVVPKRQPAIVGSGFPES
jgi:hypothetical protein